MKTQNRFLSLLAAICIFLFVSTSQANAQSWPNNCGGTESEAFILTVPKPFAANFDGTCSGSKCNYSLVFSGTTSSIVFLEPGTLIEDVYYDALVFQGGTPSCPNCPVIGKLVVAFRVTVEIGICD